jgi:integrase
MVNYAGFCAVCETRGGGLKARFWLQPIVKLAVNTGMRRGEILKLRWLDFDENHKSLILPQTKNGESRIVYLNQAAKAVLMSLPQIKVKIFPDITRGQSALPLSSCRKAFTTSRNGSSSGSKFIPTMSSSSRQGLL